MKKIGQILLFFFAFGVAFYAMSYWGFDRISLLNTKADDVFSNQLFRLSFYGHVIFGPIALMIGPFQFMPKFRNKRMSLHRNLGKVYVLACLLAGLAGLSAAQFATGSKWNTLWFSMLALSWLVTTTMAWSVIRKKDIEAHRKWMLRSYALTLSAVTLRTQLGIFQGFFGMTFFESYDIVAWSCWVPNLIIIEWWIRKKLLPQHN